MLQGQLQIDPTQFAQHARRLATLKREPREWTHHVVHDPNTGVNHSLLFNRRSGQYYHVLPHGPMSEAGMGSALTDVQSAVPIAGSIMAVVPAVAAIPLAGPIIGAAMAGISLIISLFNKQAQNKVATTAIVNKVAPYLQQNLAAWNQSQKTQSEQAQALQNFDSLWQQVVSQCSQPQFDGPGERCISDRQRGSTKGYDWFKLYRDPIANDPHVIPDAQAAAAQAAGAVSSIFGSGSSSMLIPLVAAGLVLWAVAS